MSNDPLTEAQMRERLLPLIVRAVRTGGDPEFDGVHSEELAQRLLPDFLAALSGLPTKPDLDVGRDGLQHDASDSRSSPTPVPLTGEKK